MRWEIKKNNEIIYSSKKYDFFSKSDLQDKKILKKLQKYMREWCIGEYEYTSEFNVVTYIDRNLCSDEECGCCGSVEEEYEIYSFLYFDNYDTINIYENINGNYYKFDYYTEQEEQELNNLKDKYNHLYKQYSLQSIEIQQLNQELENYKKSIFKENREEDYKNSIKILTEKAEQLKKQQYYIDTIDKRLENLMQVILKQERIIEKLKEDKNV